MKQYNETIRGKLFNYFQQRLGTKRSTRGWFRVDCIYCNRPQAMGINLTQYKCHCFGCLEKMNPMQLLMEIEGFMKFTEAYQFLKLQDEFDSYKDYVSKAVAIKDVELPDSFKLITEKGSYIGKFARNYLKGRGFKLSAMEAAGVGYCTKGEYAGYIIFPVYNNNRLVFYQGRKFIDIGPKMRNPEFEKFGIGKTQVMYNADALFIYNEVYLVESITNALTIGPKAVASFGKELSPWQMSLIIHSPCQRVTLIYDNDAYYGALKQAMQLVHYKKIKVILMPLKKDVNDIGRKKTVRLKRVTPWQSYRDLLKIKINLDEKGAIHPHLRERLNLSPTRGF
jgi:DNA primase